MMTDDEVIEKLEETFRDATRHQLQAMDAILERNAAVGYLRCYLHGRDAPPDAATFRGAVPLSCYDDYSDHINKLADGNLIDDHGQPLLCVDPLLCFFYSSGTSTMNPKLLPYFESKQGRTASSFAHQGTGAILRRSFPPKSSSNKNLGFIYAGNVAHTKGGYTVMAATAFPFYNSNPNASRILSNHVSPKEVILGTDVNQQMYCHLLCGLRQYDVIDAITAPYAAGLIKAFDLLKSKWEKLSKDLENGIPCSEITDDAMRQSVITVLGGPQSDLAKRVRLICQETSWDGIVGKLWPNARYLKCVSTGSMALYYPKLESYAGGIAVLGGDYFASECCVAINLDISQPPEFTQYVILPTAAYFEFLPFNVDGSLVENHQTVDISGVEVGKMYEIVVTTYRGFYRLRLGDIVKVVGFHHTSPKVEFVMRAPKDFGEIISEKDLICAMENFQLVLRDEFADDEVVDFACFVNLESELKGLKIFVEVKNENKFSVSADIVRKCCYVLEDGLGGMYHVMKGRDEIRPLLVSILRSGSFHGLLEEAVRNGAPASQYKPPKIIRSSKIVDFLEKFSVVTLSLHSSHA